MAWYGALINLHGEGGYPAHSKNMIKNKIIYDKRFISDSYYYQRA